MKSLINKFHFKKLVLETGVWGVLEQTIPRKGKLSCWNNLRFCFHQSVFILFGECGEKQGLKFLVNWEIRSNHKAF